MFKEAGRGDHLRPQGRFLQNSWADWASHSPQGLRRPSQGTGLRTDMATQQRKSLKEMSNHAQFLTLMEPSRHMNCLEDPQPHPTPVWTLDLERDLGQQD